MKTTTKKPAPRTHIYSVVTYYGRSIAAWSFRSTSISAAKRKANLMGLGGRAVMTAAAARKILNRA